LALVGKARSAGDDEQPANARERGDDLLDHAVGEIFLLGITAEVDERQHSERGLVRNGRIQLGSGVGGGGFLRTQQPITAPGDGHDAVFAAAAFFERLAQRPDVDLKIVFLDDDLGPDPLHQLVFADDRTPGRCQ
jgi:hypothetical protein